MTYVPIELLPAAGLDIVTATDSHGETVLGGVHGLFVTPLGLVETNPHQSWERRLNTFLQPLGPGVVEHTGRRFSPYAVEGVGLRRPGTAI